MGWLEGGGRTTDSGREKSCLLSLVTNQPSRLADNTRFERQYEREYNCNFIADSERARAREIISNLFRLKIISRHKSWFFFVCAGLWSCESNSQVRNALLIFSRSYFLIFTRKFNKNYVRFLPTGNNLKKQRLILSLVRWTIILRISKSWNV